MVRTYLAVVASVALVPSCTLLVSTAELVGGEVPDAATADAGSPTDAVSAQDAMNTADACALVPQQSDGPRDPSSAVVLTGAGSGWNSPERVGAGDQSYAQASRDMGQSSRTLYASGFGLTVPVGAVVTGVEVIVTRRMSALTSTVNLTDRDVVLISKGNAASLDRARSDNWESTDTTVTYGGPEDTWGTSWSASEIGDATFGVGFSAQHDPVVKGMAQALVDHIAVKVYFRRCE